MDIYDFSYSMGILINTICIILENKIINWEKKLVPN